MHDDVNQGGWPVDIGIAGPGLCFKLPDFVVQVALGVVGFFQARRGLHGFFLGLGSSGFRIGLGLGGIVGGFLGIGRFLLGFAQVFLKFVHLLLGRGHGGLSAFILRLTLQGFLSLGQGIAGSVDARLEVLHGLGRRGQLIAGLLGSR